MPQLINRYPLGLLSLLDSKSGGYTPSGLLDVVQPTIDLTRFYIASDQSRASQVDQAVVGVGFQTAGSNVVVPPGEFWLVTNTTGESDTLGAGQTFQVAVGARYTASGPFFMLTPLSNVATVGQVALAGPQIGTIVLPPGTIVGAYTTQLVAGPVNFNFHLKYARLAL